MKALLLACAALSLAGCARLQETVTFSRAVLVKVPSQRIVARPRPSPDGWNFRHILEAPKGGGRDGQWYVAWNPDRPYRASRLNPYWCNLFRRTPEIADAVRYSLGGYPVLIEPNRTFKRPPGGTRRESQSEVPPECPHDAEHCVRVNDRQLASPAWPAGRGPLWHLDDEHSQLARARTAFALPGEGILIGHLDNGIDDRHIATPRRLHPAGRLEASNAVGLFERLVRSEKPGPQASKERHTPAAEFGAEHGLGTVAILAGGEVVLQGAGVLPEDAGKKVTLGGAPYATVLPVRVAPWVVSLGTMELAYGIDFASRVHRCDVLSLSHGGAPTQAWVDAVNAAYERGTAIFAAEGNFFSLLFDPLMPQGVILPSSPVYPAAFRRVMGVTGATAAQSSYGRNSLGALLRHPSKVLSWGGRGSYGADGTSTAFLRPDSRPDLVQTREQGELRPHPIAAYSPNMPWATLERTPRGTYVSKLDLDGGGTSSATPQVAAAAALWLQKNRAQIPSGKWRSWEKVEAVYCALLASARAKKAGASDPYLGVGTLRAADALTPRFDYRAIVQRHRPASLPADAMPPPGSLYFGRAAEDHFAGADTFLSFFGFNTRKHVPPPDRALLRQVPAAGETREAALARLFYNQWLLREWHGGDTPRRGREEAMYLRRGASQARRADPPDY